MKDEQVGQKQLRQFGRTDPLHLQTGQSGQQVLANRKHPETCDLLMFATKIWKTISITNAFECILHISSPLQLGVFLWRWWQVCIFFALFLSGWFGAFSCRWASPTLFSFFIFLSSFSSFCCLKKIIDFYKVLTRHSFFNSQKILHGWMKK